MISTDSNIEDCFMLSGVIKKELGKNVEFNGSAFKPFVSGRFVSNTNIKNGNYNKFLPFHYKFNKNEYLKLSVGSFYNYEDAYMEKLAALSDLYMGIKNYYYEPSVFYSTVNGSEEKLVLEWLFKNKDEYINLLKKGINRDNEKVNDLIVISNNIEDLRTKGIGLPYDLTFLVDDDLSLYLSYKKNDDYLSRGLVKTKRRF